MEPRSELLVFNRKEIGVIITLLVLVAMFSFTLGLRLGKTLAVAKAQTQEGPPLSPKAEPKAEEKVADDKTEAPKQEAALAKDAAKPVGTADPAAKAIEDAADTELAAETEKEKVTVGTAMPMALPKEKKSLNAGHTTRYTLQFGAYRTMGEAAEQVTALKHKDLDAQYLEADVKGKGKYFRVIVGTFSNKDDAERAGAKWKSEKGLPDYIVRAVAE
jgi:cell division septation protein DedD